MRYEDFEFRIVTKAQELVNRWCAEYGVEKVGIVIVSDESIVEGPYFYSAVYVPNDVTHAGVVGPAILIAEEYLRTLYRGVISYRNLDEGLKIAENIVVRCIAHEFAHHLTRMRILKRIIRLKISNDLGEVLRRLEVSANVKATLMTGKTVAAEFREFEELTGIPVVEWIHLRTVELNELWRRKHG